MRFKAALRGVRNGQRKVLRLQRRLWFAELALWPTAILSAILMSVGARAWWQRKSRERQADTVTATSAPADAPESAVAGPVPGH
jgi:hypothetical protein